MIYAVYRGLYGADFVEYSIRSLLPHVDKVVFVWGIRPFADTSEGLYQGRPISIPGHIDDLCDKVDGMPQKEVHLVPYHHTTPRNQWTRIVNEVVIPDYGKPDLLILMHPTFVWRQDELAKALAEFAKMDVPYANSRQVEVWRGFRHRAPERQRSGAWFWDMRGLARLPETGLDPHPKGTAQASAPHLQAQVHNLKFCQNPNLMFWRSVIVPAYVRKTGDSKSDPTWFDKKWLTWDAEVNNENLEEAMRWQHMIPKAVPYDVAQLPEEIVRDLDSLTAATSNASWAGVPEGVRA